MRELNSPEEAAIGKIVKAVAMLAVVVAIAIAAPYLAPGIVSAFGALGVTITVATATTIGFAALTTVAGIVMMALTPKPGSGTSAPQDIRQSVGDSQVVIGKCRMGGKLTFFYPSGKKLRYFVWTVAGHRVKGLTKWYLNDREVTVNATTGEVLSGDYKNNAWLWFDRGTDDATANSTFVAECGGKWTTDHRGRGIAKIYAKFNLSSDVISAGMPNITCEIEGSDSIYDPRTDTTGYTNNAILAFYWWMKLPRTEGGFGCYDDEIDWDWVSAQANVCDEPVNVKWILGNLADDYDAGDHSIRLESVQGLAVGSSITIGGYDETHTVSAISGTTVTLDSGLEYAYNADTEVKWQVAASNPVTEKRYALDGYLTTGADPSSVRDVLVQNMAGRFTYSGGLMLARPGYWVPVSNTLSEDDLTAGISLDLLTAGDQRTTEIDATWLDPTNLYQQIELPARSVDSDDVAQVSLDLPFVKSRSRAERIQKIKLMQGQAQKKVSWPMNIVGLGIGPMDTVQCDTARYGLSNYAFTVANWSINQDFSISLTLQEENEDMYAWDPSTDETDVAIVDSVGGVNTSEVPDAPEAGSWSATAGDGGSIIVTGAVDDDAATGIVVAYRVHGTTGWTTAGSYPVSTTRMEISGLLGATSYDVAVSYSDDAGAGDQLILDPVTTGTTSVDSAATATTANQLGGTYSASDITTIINRLDAADIP